VLPRALLAFVVDQLSDSNRNGLAATNAIGPR